jgi:hypothetical protein
MLTKSPQTFLDMSTGRKKQTGGNHREERWPAQSKPHG